VLRRIGQSANKASVTDREKGFRRGDRKAEGEIYVIKKKGVPQNIRRAERKRGPSELAKGRVHRVYFYAKKKKP